ncbi:hypothetical protein HS088_TW08G00250 [Tripterygium wilfordii]|uniref:CASP-like protein n=1 Tax=Tripterygium wilfordii TaxID=458696 RepID=A0A7J7DBB0_TRIWF|nr:hypothetical protein HS088_TW08G00250 [Tripterygium wilfordii]
MSSIGDKYPTMKTQKIQNGAQVCLRILTIATTLAATWLVFTDKQTIEIFGLKMDARYSYSPAFKIKTQLAFLLVPPRSVDDGDGAGGMCGGDGDRDEDGGRT